MNTDLLLAAQYAVTGLDMIYEALENGRHSEALLHAGHHCSRLRTAVKTTEAQLKADEEWRKQFRDMSEAHRGHHGTG